MAAGLVALAVVAVAAYAGYLHVRLRRHEERVLIFARWVVDLERKRYGIESSPGDLA